MVLTMVRWIYENIRELMLVNVAFSILPKWKKNMRVATNSAESFNI